MHSRGAKDREICVRERESTYPRSSQNMCLVMQVVCFNLVRFLSVGEIKKTA